MLQARLAKERGRARGRRWRWKLDRSFGTFGLKGVNSGGISIFVLFGTLLAVERVGECGLLAAPRVKRGGTAPDGILFARTEEYLAFGSRWDMVSVMMDFWAPVLQGHVYVLSTKNDLVTR
jgi:hypothetical protein